MKTENFFRKYLFFVTYVTDLSTHHLYAENIKTIDELKGVFYVNVLFSVSGSRKGYGMYKDPGSVRKKR